MPGRCNPAGCKPEKTGNLPGKTKPREHCFTMSRGVEVAGFETQPQSSRLHTVEIASYRLRKDSMKFPPLAVIESFPRGLLVPNSRIWISDRPMRVFAIFPRLCNEKPRISENFRFFHAIFKVDILPFRLILKVQFGVQPGRLQHSPGHALPFGQSCTPSNSLILLFFSSTRALERPYIRSTSFASRMNLSTSSYDSSKP